MYDLIVRGARLGGETVDVAVAGGRIARISSRIDGTAGREIDAGGRLLSPPYIESHVHLDTTLTAGEPRWNESGTLFEGIRIWSERKGSVTREDVMERATQLLRWQAAQGVLHVRTHADVTDPELVGLQALLEVREKVRDWIDVQIVAFPQEGMISYPRGTELVEEALRLGADVVGGIPHYEHTREMGVESVKETFRLAEKYDRPVDIHCDETDDPHSRFLEVMAAEAIRTGMGERVTASHTTAFGSYDNAYAFKLMGFLAKADINFVANPLVNITLQGRYDAYPKRRGITRVKELWQNGLNVSLGYDDVMDPWYPLGTGGMLQPAHMTVHACHMTGRREVVACYEMVTTNAARTLGLEGYGVAEGGGADFVLVDAPNEWDAIRRLASVVLVVKGGEVISETRPPETRLMGEVVDFRREGREG
ncbi:Cytosine deaminase [Rubrobacter xylanophilus DSM 9941]|uniref:cytosine deaminase n=1 Tax=Rubrobacter xylanophilus TaxID=49319 RepID=UPI001C641062|nr:cytosine deaminase [Rubrobacter xylanophilus]QYJ16451.1 Cytosine deaminase [Rubrobacter xylanophilus DSM 9941]